MEELNQIIYQIKAVLIPGGNLLIPFLIVCIAFGLYLFTTGLAGIIWPSPDIPLSDHELVRLEVSEERETFRRQLRQKHPVYKIPFLERNLRPLVEEIGHFISKGFQQLGLGKAANQDLERNLDLLGTGETLAGFYGQRLASAITLGIVGLVCHLSGVIDLSLLMLLSLLAIGYYLPSISLHRKAKQMREEALSQLPAFIDLLSINVQSGMGLENAIERVSRMGTGALPNAVRRAFDEAQYRNILTENKRLQARKVALDGNSIEKLALVVVGLDEEAGLFSASSHKHRGSGSRNLTFQALQEMADRFRIPELDDVVATLETSDRQGIPVTDTLRALATLMRDKKKAKLVEIGNRSLVKMLVPVAVFILPAFLLLLLTPALLQFLALSK